MNSPLQKSNPMSRLLPYLEGKSFPAKFGTLLLLIAFSFVVINVVGILVAIPFYGLDILYDFDQSYDYSDPEKISFLKYLQVVSQIGVFILPAWVYAYLYNRKPGNYLMLKDKIDLYPLFLALLTIIVSIPFINFLVSWNEQMSFPGFLRGLEDWMRNMENQAGRMTEAFLRVDTIGGLLVNLFIIAFLAALGEELLFRGVILRMLSESLKNIHLAVLLSAILFSAFHGQFYGFLPRTVLGVFFGYIFIWTGTLWIPIILHMIFNAVSVVVAYLYTIDRISTNYEDFGESASTWIIVLSGVFSLVLMWMIHSKRKIAYNPDPAAGEGI